jgi:uncharacterized membrane protein (UPF0182 family)
MNLMDPGQPVTIHFDPEKAKIAAKRGCGCFVFIIFGFLLLAAVGPYTEYLWFAHDVRHPEVMATAYGTQGSLFLIGFLATLGSVYFSLRTALNQSMIFFDRPITLGQKIITNAMGWVQNKGKIFTKVAALVLSIFSGLGFSGEWNTFLLSRAGGTFGKTDPHLGIDLGFYIFHLPWYRAIANFAFGLALVTTISTIALYVILQVLAALARIELGRPKIRMHISILIAALAVTFGFQMWLKTYEFGTMPSAQFMGAGYAAMSQISGMKVAAILSLLLAVWSLATVRSKVPYQGVIGGGIFVGAAYLLGIVIVPGVIQRLVVDPDKLAKEGPFAKNAIEMTRFAYGLDRVEVKDMTVQDAPSIDAVKGATSTLDNMRLWDPEIIRQAFEQSQTFRRYYAFNDVDIDRYPINGKPTMVMVSPRDVRIDKLDASAQSWVNTRLQYTHGYGVVASPVNAAGPSGEPQMLVRDIPVTSIPDLAIKEPRIYFSDFRDESGQSFDEYALVKTKVPEFDYIVEDKTVTYRWTGNSGIPISGLLARLAFSIALGDGNLLVSGNITDESRLLYRRSILDRAGKLYPFLRFDADPYLVIHESRLVWIMDGYTTSDMMPYSDRVGDEGSDLNYIRNSVKVTIDAFSGETNAYALDQSEPILKAYRTIYPKLVKDFSEFPKGLEGHLRYPEDQLRLQALMIRQYHITDPSSFLNNGDAWDIPNQRIQSTVQVMRPYYVLMRLPNEPKDGFMQILPFSPRQKGNLAGWLAAHCDPGDLGKIVLYKFTRGSLIPGPELMESNFNQNEAISNINRQLQNDQSDIKVGNLLIIPIGQSVMYVEPLFLQGKNLQAIPQMRKVVLALKGKIVVGDTYREALDKLFGESSGKANPTGPSTGQANPTRTSGTTNEAGIRDALGLLDQADQALRAGDFAKYGALQKQAREKLKQLSSGSSLPQ